MRFSLLRNARKRESVIGTGPGGMEPSGVAGPATSDCGAPDEVAASVAGVEFVGACGADHGLSSAWIRRARVSGSGGVTSPLSPSGAPGPGNEEPRRWSVGDELIPEAADAVPIACDKLTPASGVAWRDVLSAISGVVLRGAGLVVKPVREGCCGGARGGGDGEEVPGCGTPRTAVFRVESAAAGGEEEVVDVDSNQEGGGNSAAIWLAFPFLPNFTNCSKA